MVISNVKCMEIKVNRLVHVKVLVLSLFNLSFSVFSRYVLHWNNA